VRFDGGQYLFHEGEEAEKFFLIRHGRIALEVFTPDRGPITIQTLEPGDILGWSWLVPPYQWRFDAKAIELVRAIALDGKCLRTKCETDHDLGYDLLKRFAHVIEQRLEATRLQLLDVYGTHA
jgi:CRP-like cAMP-binding protein